MALLVETGAGILGAEAYASVAATDTYWSNRGGNADWSAATVSAKEAALRVTSEFLDITYLVNQSPYVDGQGLSFPFDGDGPSLGQIALVQKATMMVAPYALISPLLDRPSAAPQVLSSTDKIGEISRSRTFAAQDTSRVFAGRDLSFLDRMFTGFGGGGLVIGHRVLG